MHENVRNAITYPHKIKLTIYREEKMDTKLLGGILLIIGTSIGASMLVLPIAMGAGGFFYSTMLLLSCWAIMTFSAFLILEVTLWLPPRTNLLSMVRATLGRWGEVIAWITYLLLLYALLSAYISGGSGIFDFLSNLLHVNFPPALDAVLFVLLFGYIVYCGIKPVDYVNRYLMLAKFGSFFLLLILAAPYVDHHNLLGGQPSTLVSAITVTLTSFGFAPLIPSLRSYFDSDVKKLRICIFIGSLTPLICYAIWNLVILGVLPREGDQGLVHLMQTGGSTSELVQSLNYFLQKSSITSIAHVFTVICVLTSFLSVSLGLSDFLADGFKVEKKGKHGMMIFLMTFLPSLLIVLFYPSIFIKALSYAGIFCTILIILMPALMIWKGRYQKNLSAGHYQVKGGKVSIILLLTVALAILGLGITKVIFGY